MYPKQQLTNVCILYRSSPPFCERLIRVVTTLHAAAAPQKFCITPWFPPCLFNRAYSIITNKDNLTKESAKIKQVYKENGCQESTISNFF